MTSHRIPRICVVGAGDWSYRMHLPAMKTLRERHLAAYTAVCDLDGHKATTYAEELGARAFTNLQEMLEVMKPDGLVLVVNPGATPKLIEFAIEHRIPFLCEKPPATDTETHRRLLKAVCDLPHIVGYNRRHAPYVTKAAEWLAGERLISITGLFSRYRRREEFSSTAVHGIDTVIYLAGDDLEEATIELAPSADGILNFFISAWTGKNVRVDLLITPDTATNEEHYIVRGHRRSARIAFPHHSTVDFPGSVELFEEQRSAARLGSREIGIAPNDAPQLGGIVAEHELFTKLIGGTANAVSTLETSLPTQAIRELLQTGVTTRTTLHWRR